MNVELKPITHSDYVHFFEKQPERTIQGYSIFLDGEMVAVVGVFLEANGKRLMFSDMKKDIKVPKITIWRWSKRALEKFANSKFPIFALTSSSDKFLQSLGFYYHNDTKYGKLYEYKR